MDGIKTLYAGRAMTVWDTYQEAEDSWRAPSVMDLIQRSETVWWRCTELKVVDCPLDVSLQDVLRKDL